MITKVIAFLFWGIRKQTPPTYRSAKGFRKGFHPFFCCKYIAKSNQCQKYRNGMPFKLMF